MCFGSCSLESRDTVIFCNADKGFSKLGYKKVHESGVYVSYEGELNEFGYVHCIDIGHRVVVGISFHLMKRDLTQRDLTTALE